jgi:hypothetical protein
MCFLWLWVTDITDLFRQSVQLLFSVTFSRLCLSVRQVVAGSDSIFMEGNWSKDNKTGSRVNWGYSSKSRQQSPGVTSVFCFLFSIMILILQNAWLFVNTSLLAWANRRLSCVLADWDFLSKFSHLRFAWVSPGVVCGTDPGNGLH